MKTLDNKRVLLAGNNQALETELTTSLSAYGATVEHKACAEASDYEGIEPTDYDLVVVTQHFDSKKHEGILKRFRATDTISYVPILVAADLHATDLHKVLSMGASDFFAVDDPVADITEKITQCFAETGEVDGDGSIDITPHQSEVDGGGKRVLVVEDDQLLRNLLSAQLERSLFAHKFNVTGHNVLEDVQSFRPDVIILDLHLPGINGLEILEELKNTSETKTIPVLIFSNQDSPEERQKAAALGAAGFYVKAMTDLTDLVELITTLEADQ